MTDRVEFWTSDCLNDGGIQNGYLLELRARLAFTLIERYGSVAGQPRGEDSAGRSILDLQTPQELVTRCFEIADLCVQECLSRGLIRKPTKTVDEMAKETARILRLQLDAETRQWRIRPEEPKDRI